MYRQTSGPVACQATATCRSQTTSSLPIVADHRPAEAAAVESSHAAFRLKPEATLSVQAVEADVRRRLRPIEPGVR